MSARFPASRPWPVATRKLAIVAAIVAFTTGASGYFMGLRQTEATAARVRDARLQPADLSRPPAAETALVAPLAPRYSELRSRQLQPNTAWRSHLASLASPPAFTAESPRPSEAEAEQIAFRRTARRAYAGAPPVVPHPIDQQQSASCLACHGRPTRVGTVDVPQMSHAMHSQCIQCHAPAGGPGSTFVRAPSDRASPVLANGFTGATGLTRGSRAHAEAPPTIPHTTAMRQNCVSCHGPGGSSAIKTTHPQRQNCVQCHALDARRETTPLALALPPAPGASGVVAPPSMALPPQ